MKLLLHSLKSILLICLLTFISADILFGQACQNTLLANDGSTSLNGRAPNLRFRGIYTHYLLTATECAAAGLVAGEPISGIGWLFSTAPGLSANVSLDIYMENSSDAANNKSATWATAISTMTLVHSNASENIPNATTMSIPTFNTTSFTYTGGALYIAFSQQYGCTGTPTFSTTQVIACNTTSTSGNLLKGFQSAASCTASTLGASAFRPATILYASSANDVKVSTVATYGQLPINFTSGHAIQVVINNLGTTAQTNLPVTLSITGANTFSDVQTIASLGPCASTKVTFAAYTPTVAGANTITVSIPADSNNTNNSVSVSQTTTTNFTSYKYPGVANTGGVGYNNGTGDIAGKFTTAIAAQINQIQVEFNTAGQPYTIGIWDATGAGGAPGTKLWTSASLTTSVGTSNINVSPMVAVSGSYYVGVQQTGTTNLSIAYQSEIPLRANSFYSTFPTGTNTWNDLVGKSYRLNLGVSYNLCSPTSSTQSATICASALPYVYFGKTFTASHLTDTLKRTNYNGCDSIVNLSVKVNPASSSSIDSTICSSQLPFSFLGHTMNAAGNDTLHLTNAANCDSLAILSLIVAPSPIVTINAPITTICSGNDVILSASSNIAVSLNGLHFNGTDSITLANENNIPSGNSPYTIEAWIKPTSATFDGIAGWGNYGSPNQVNAFRCTGSTSMTNYWWGNDFTVTVPNLSDGNWHHVAATYDGTTRSIYTDGVLRGSDNPTGHNVTIINNLTIGSACTNCAGNPLNGDMDEIRIWNIGRSQFDIQSTMNTRILPTNTAGLVLYYRMDETTDTLVTDATGNGNTGRFSHSGGITHLLPSSAPIYGDYTWSTSSTASMVKDAPLVSTNYTVTATTLAGCTGSAQQLITVLQPTSSITNKSICASELPYSYLGHTMNAVGHDTLHLINAANCDSLAILNLTLSTIPGDPTVFGNHSWNVYAFNQGGGSLGNTNWSGNYAGYYTDSSLNINTMNNWNPNLSPSQAANYLGCPVTNDSHSYTAKRKGFACGRYQLDVPGHDDASELLINGVSVWSHNGCCDSHTNVWTGILSDKDSIEYRTTEGGGLSYEELNFNLLTTSATHFITGNASFCNGSSTTLSVPAIPNYKVLWSTNDSALSINANTVGIYTAHLYSALYTCQFNDTIAVSIKQPTSSFTSQTICASQLPYSYLGHIMTKAGNDTLHLTNAASCDSIAVLSLIVNQPTSTKVSKTICSTQLPYTYLGHTMNAAGKDTLHLTNAKGCDSLAILNLTVNIALSSSVTLAPPTGNSCFAGATTFTATATNGGANPIYEWFLNGASVGFHPSPYTRALYLNNSIVKVKVYPQGVCAATSLSNNDTVQVIKPIATITRNGGTVICPGTPITFRATALGCSKNPTLSYQWTINRLNVGGNVDTFISTTLQTHDTVRCKLVDAACPALPSQSNVYPMTIKSPVIPSVSLAALSANSVCFASPVTFTVTATNAGTNPIYQWFLNGVNDGFHPSPYTRPIYTNNTIVKVKVYPQVACPATSLSNSDTVQMIKPLATVTRNGGAVICPGAPITFRATASGCSKNPTLSYQWTINRNPVGGNVDTFISTTLQTHDTVRCKLVDAACPALPSQSNIYPMTIKLPIIPSVSLAAPSANNVCFASPVTFTVTATNAGTNPIYQWFLNGANDGFHTSPYTRKIYTNNSIVKVKVYPQVACPTTAMSNSDTIQIHTCTIVRLQAPNSNEDKEAIAGIELYPNPAMDNVTIRYQLPENNVDAAQISILDITGKQVQAQTIEHPETIGIAKFDLSNLQAGVYLVNVKTTGFTQTQKLVVSK